MKKIKEKSNFRKIFPYFLKKKKSFSILLILMLIRGGLAIVAPIFSASALAALAEKNYDLTLQNILIFAIIQTVMLTLSFFEDRSFFKFYYGVQRMFVGDMIKKLNSTQLSKLDEVGLGGISGKLLNDTAEVGDVYIELINSLFTILTNIVFIVYIAFLNFYMFVIVLSYVIISFIVARIKSRVWIKGLSKAKNSHDIAKASYFEQISGIRDAKLLNITEELTNRSNRKFDDYIKVNSKFRRQRSALAKLQSFILVVFEVILIVCGITLAKMELITAAGILIIYTYQGRVSNFVNFSSYFIEKKAEGEVSAGRILEIMENYPKETFGDEKLENFSGNIRFQNVRFSYNDKDKVLKGLNLNFKPKQITAIVGKSGAGKTTILNLLSKLYVAQSGKILFDDKDIMDLDEQSIRGNVGEVSQMPYIFNASIRENLLFAKPDATDEELIAVLKKAYIYEDVSKMPDGLNTKIGENGIKLSGGQRQRIAIARLLLKDCKVIVFDEATSALDNKSQNKIVEVLNSLKKDKTIIIVAHRLSTIVSSDKIYMIEKGKVVGKGRHSELMTNCPMYHDLYTLEESQDSDIIEE